MSGVKNPLRIFTFSLIVTIVALGAVLWNQGFNGALLALVLILVEVIFSFDNALLNASILKKMSPFWQRMFLTVGVLIAIFGMRIIFPVAIVAISTHLSLLHVIDIAFNQPEIYAKQLTAAHPVISAFGGAFLLMLGLHYFVDGRFQQTWPKNNPLVRFERLALHWAPPLITLSTLSVIVSLPFNISKAATFVAGIIGMSLYSVLHLVRSYFSRLGRKRMSGQGATQVGVAAFLSFLYLEILDANFSFDSVLGAFVVTKKVILIAIGLGVGALWVRSLTIFMVRRGTLDQYKYVEPGVHVAIIMLGYFLLIGIVYEIPEVVTGLVSTGIIGVSLWASRRAVAKSDT